MIRTGIPPTRSRRCRIAGPHSCRDTGRNTWADDRTEHRSFTLRAQANGVSVQSNLDQSQRRQITLMVRVTPYAMAGHVLNTTVLAIAVAGSVPSAELIVWCIYSYSVGLFLLFRHLKNRGRSPQSFHRAAKKATIYAVFLALPWSSLAVLHLGALSHDGELILVAVGIGMAACGTVLLSAIPPAALSYISVILIPGALKCFILNQEGYLLLGTLALSSWGCLSALIAKMNRDVREHERAEVALAERNVQLALAEQAALVGSYGYDVSSDRMQVSNGYAAIHGLPDGTAEIARNKNGLGVHPEDLVRMDTLRSQAFRERQGEYNVEYPIFRSDGKVRWIESRNFISYHRDGHPQRVVGVNIDVTERKELEEHKNLLMGELDHRVKNVLAMVSVIASRTLETSSSMAEFVSAFNGRIKSLEMAHELLSRHRWQGVSLAELVHRELAPYVTNSNTQIEGSDEVLTAEAGQAIAMVLHELATNAAKYGALSCNDGRVSVRWRQKRNGQTDSLVCINWEESGGPSVVHENRVGYGSSVIRELIPHELDGTVDLVYAFEGVRCNLEFSTRWLSSNRPVATSSDSAHGNHTAGLAKEPSSS